MRAMILRQQGSPLESSEVSMPVYGSDEVLIRILACAVCRTDLHVCDGDLADPKLPLIPGHEIVGEIVECGSGVHNLKPGDRVGVPWLGYTCGQCNFCNSGYENLCDQARFTGYNIDGGYAEYTVAHQQFVFLLPEMVSPVATVNLESMDLVPRPISLPRLLFTRGGMFTRLPVPVIQQHNHLPNLWV